MPNALELSYKKLPRASEDVKAAARKSIAGKPKCGIHTIGPKIAIGYVV